MNDNDRNDWKSNFTSGIDFKMDTGQHKIVRDMLRNEFRVKLIIDVIRFIDECEKNNGTITKNNNFKNKSFTLRIDYKKRRLR